MSRQIVRKYLKPGKGRAVRDPVTRRRLPTKGAWTVLTSFYVRRLKDGDAVECEPPVAPPASTGFPDGPTDTEPVDELDADTESE